MKAFKALLVCMILTCYPLSAWCADDWEVWPDNTIKVKLNDKVSLDFLNQFRVHDDMSTFYTYVLYAGSYIKINKYIDTAVWYKFVESKKHNHWEASHRYDIDGIVKYDFEWIKLSDRSRFEHNVTKNAWLYRNRIKVSQGFDIYKHTFTPYFSNEFFIDFGSDGGYHENRATVGITTGFIYGTKIGVYYMSRATKSGGEWNNANVLGVSTGITF
jgi:hypothetical protein